MREEAGIPAETATDSELQQLFRAAGAQILSSAAPLLTRSENPD